jgi:hypothetical protein
MNAEATQELQAPRLPLRSCMLTSAMRMAIALSTLTVAQADLVGHWITGAPNLTETSGAHPAGRHDGVAVGGNAAALAFSNDVPTGFNGQSLNLSAGNVGVLVANSATTDAGYVPTYDDGVRTHLTVTFWAKGFPGTWNPWVSKRGENGIGWQVRRFSNSSGACFTIRGLDEDDGGGSPINVNDSPPKWRHYAAVWDEERQSRTLYVDGIYSHEVNNSFDQSMVLAANKHLAIGTRQSGGEEFEGFFPGLLFDVRIYNHALSESEVIDLIPPAVPPSLVATPGNLKVALSWTPVFGAHSYTVWTKNTVTNVEQTNTVIEPPFIKTALTNGVPYLFKVRANIGGNSSPYSAEIGATPSLGTAKDILTFTFPYLGPATISGTTILKQVPLDTDVTELGPEYTHSPVASGDAEFPSGTYRDFTTPQSYTITAEDGSTKTYTVQITRTAPVTFDFNTGLQGWSQKFPNIAAGSIMENGALGSGHDAGETRFGRSPEFLLNNSGPLTFQLDGGQSPLGAPHVGPAEIPELAIDSGGFGGVALRDVAANTYVLSKSRFGNGGGFQEYHFTVEEIAPFANNNRRYTLDYLDYNKGGWGWTYLDNVSIPGALTPAADITSISLFGSPGGIGPSTITLHAPFGTSLAALAPVYSLSPGATCDKPSGSPQNFTSPVIYQVTSSDQLTTRSYTVTVTVLPDPSTALVGQWITGANHLKDTSGHAPAGTHDGIAVGTNAAALTYNADDVPLSFSGSSLDLRAGNVGVMIQNTVATDPAYRSTFDDPLRSQFTVTLWAKGFPGTWAPWVSKGGEDGVGWQIRRMANESIAGLTVRNVDNVDGFGSSLNVNDNPPKWRHFAGVWDQATGNRALYIDGVLSHDATNTLGQVMTLATSKHLALGARQTASDTFDAYFSGLLFDVRIYNQALFASQVQSVMTTSTVIQPPEAKIRAFGLPNHPATLAGNVITWQLPLTTNLTALAPTITTTGATTVPASGTTRDFTTPQIYTVTSSDSQTRAYTVKIVLGSTFNDGTLEGWHNRVWDASAEAWVDLPPNVTTLPATINEGLLQPESIDNGLFETTGGAVESNGHHDSHLNTLWLR